MYIHCLHTDMQWFQYSHVVLDNLFSIVSLCVRVEMAKVIHQWAHAGREVDHTVHQLSQRDLAC